MWVAAEARALGHGGIAAVMRATGISRSTIQRGLQEADSGAVLPAGRTRRTGGGRRRLAATDTTLVPDLEALIDPSSAGEPDSPLRWTTRSTRSLASALRALGHAVSHTAVAARFQSRLVGPIHGADPGLRLYESEALQVRLF